MGWTGDDILAMAPDASSARAGRELAVAGRWVSLGHDESACWGECKGSGAKPYQTQVDLSSPAFKCSCPSRKFPCKHGLALLLLHAERRDAFVLGTTPTWVTEWLGTRAQKAEKQAKKAQEARESATAGLVNPDTKPSRGASSTANRELKVGAGVDELGRWLIDLVGQGLAQAQGKPYSFWEGMAARMIDAQAPGLARLVRELAGIPGTGDGWHDRLLERLSDLFLLIEGYRRIDGLSEPNRDDIRARIGWTEDQQGLLATAPGTVDVWMVLGRIVTLEERLKSQRTWLIGRGTGRSALILHFAHGSQPLDISLVPGTQVTADVVHFPGAWPLRAVVRDRTDAPAPLDPIAGETSIARAVATFGAALAQNPWIERFPLLLSGVVPELNEARWTVRDAEAYKLPLAPRFERIWHLLAISGGRPVTIFGEWDGQFLYPLSIWGEEGFRILNGTEGLQT